MGSAGEVLFKFPCCDATMGEKTKQLIIPNTKIFVLLGVFMGVYGL